MPRPYIVKVATSTSSVVIVSLQTLAVLNHATIGADVTALVVALSAITFLKIKNSLQGQTSSAVVGGRIRRFPDVNLSRTALHMIYTRIIPIM